MLYYQKMHWTDYSLTTTHSVVPNHFHLLVQITCSLVKTSGTMLVCFDSCVSIQKLDLVKASSTEELPLDDSAQLAINKPGPSSMDLGVCPVS